MDMFLEALQVLYECIFEVNVKYELKQLGNALFMYLYINFYKFK